MQVSVRTWNDKSNHRLTDLLSKRQAEEQVDREPTLFRRGSRYTLSRAPAAGLKALEHGCHRHGRTVDG
jgi:hypothetical protein